MIPTIHNNGTDKQSLIQERMDVRASLEQAIELLKKSAPNGRDYYLTGNLAEVMMEHRQRITVLQDMADALYAEAIAIDAQ